MNLLITGSRCISNLVVNEVLDGFHSKYPFDKLIHGNARGVDKAAAAWARQSKHSNMDEIERVAFDADWDQHGKAAGLIRNREMLDACEPTETHYLAIWDGKSTGTAHMVGLMREKSYSLEDDFGFVDLMPWHEWKDWRLAWRVA